MADRGRVWSQLTMLAVAGVFTATGAALGRRAPRPQVAGGGVLAAGVTGEGMAGADLAGVGTGAGVTGRGRSSQAPSRKARREGFEPKDISARGAAMVIGGWLIVVLLVIVGLATLRGVYGRQDRAAAPPVTAQTGAPVVPPGPRLQADPPRDLASLRNYEAQVLDNYATLPDDPAHARIPLTRAMQRVIGRSLDPLPSAGGKPDIGIKS